MPVVLSSDPPGHFGEYGAAQESNLPSLGLPDLTGFEDRLGHRAHAAPVPAYPWLGVTRELLAEPN
jgi:hypothetical protein